MLAASALAFGTCTAIAASAAEPVRLEWRQGADANSCIDERELADRVRNRLRVDPFDAAANKLIRGEIHRTNGRWVSRIVVESGEGEPFIRNLSSESVDCDALSDAVVLAVALVIDPEAGLAPESALESSPVTSTPAAAPKLQCPSCPPVARAGASREAALRGELSLNAVGQIGLLPRASVGGGLGGAMWVSDSLYVQLDALVFPHVLADDEAFSFGAALAGAAGCGSLLQARFGRIDACVGASGGTVRGIVLRGDRTQPGERAWLGLKAGLSGALALGAGFSLGWGAQVVAPVTRYRFYVEGSDRTVFEQPRLSSLFSLGVSRSFP